MSKIKVPGRTFSLADEVDLAYRGDGVVDAHPLVPVDKDILQALEAIDRKALRQYRLARIREQLKQHDYAGILLADPLNIRYAADTLSLGGWVMHAPSRYVFIATDGPVILFDFTSSKHVETIDEIRPTTPWIYFLAGPRVDEKAAIWARQIGELVRQHGGGNQRLAVDRCDPWGGVRIASPPRASPCSMRNR